MMATKDSGWRESDMTYNDGFSPSFQQKVASEIPTMSAAGANSSNPKWDTCSRYRGYGFSETGLSGVRRLMSELTDELCEP